jgi:hypothetical protein
MCSGVKQYYVIYPRIPTHYTRVSLNDVSCKEKVEELCVMRVDSMLDNKAPV